jgi:hypothetical protein
MKFQLSFNSDVNGAVMTLTPQNDGEEQLLRALCGGNKPFSTAESEPLSATVMPSWSADRPPYRKVTAVQIVVAS